MVKKKRVKKKVSTKKPKTHKKAVSTQSVEIKMQPILVNNFVALQRVMVNLSSKFENLNQQLSRLLELFELSAKTLAKRDFKFGQGEDNEKVVEKLTELSEENKVLAKGLTMIHEDEQEQRMALPTIPTQLAPQKQIPVPKMPSFPKLPKPMTTKPSEGEYQKSAPSSKPNEISR